MPATEWGEAVCAAVVLRPGARTGFSAGVDEVANDRVLAGIHFRGACDVATSIGTDVAAYIIENLMGRIHGSDD